MSPKSFKALSLLCSLVVLVTGCKHAPKITTCVSDPEAQGFQCMPPISGLCNPPLERNPDGETCFLPFHASGNYVAFSPDDAQALFTYCKQKGQ
jgi:hypothetical protein